MADIGRLLKEAQKMQKKLQSTQEELSKRVIDITQGGGAVKVSIDGQGQFKSISIDPDFLKEDPAMVNETVFLAIQEAQTQSKALSESEMGKIAGGAGMPSIPGLF